MGAEPGRPPQLPRQPVSCEGSRALAAPLPRARAAPPPVRPAGRPVAVTFFSYRHLLRSYRRLSGLGEWLFQPFSLYSPSGSRPRCPGVAGGAPAGLRDFVFSHGPGRRKRCLPRGWCFFPSRSFLVAHNFLAVTSSIRQRSHTDIS